MRVITRVSELSSPSVSVSTVGLTCEIISDDWSSSKCATDLHRGMLLYIQQ